jgi:cytochrome c oxidase cbb3-type subunit 3
MNNEFFSPFWSWWIIIVSLGGILACVWLARWMSGATVQAGEEVQTMGHVWDENLSELNNPLPKWWLNMFYITIAFGLVYLVLYPGLGAFKGVLHWTQVGQYEQEVQRADEKYGPIFKHYAAIPIPELIKEPKALAIGQRMFLNYCATCHGSDAGGGPGFPSLKDGDWLYGGEPQTIQTSIMGGRNGIMPPMGAAVGGEEGIEQVAAYVMSLSGRKVDPQLAEAGKAKFVVCAACHGPDGKGNKALGAPNLTDKVWLYGGSPETIKKTIREGRSGHMPAHKDFLGEDKSHIVAAYIYSLSAPK